MRSLLRLQNMLKYRTKVRGKIKYEVPVSVTEHVEEQNQGKR